MSEPENLWSGRFTGKPDAEVFQFQASFAFDRRLFEDDVQGSLAWVEALAGAGVLSAEEAATIQDGLSFILDQGRQDPEFFNTADEDVHTSGPDYSRAGRVADQRVLARGVALQFRLSVKGIRIPVWRST